MRRPWALILLVGTCATVHLVWHFCCGWRLVAAASFLWTLLALAAIDIDRHILPDRLTLPLLWAGLVINLQDGFVPLESAVIGAMAGYLAPWLIYHVHHRLTAREAIGYGDFKMMAALGAWLGWESLPLCVLISALCHLVTVVLFGRLVGDIDLRRPVPFGPFLALGGWVVLIWGDMLARLILVTSLRFPGTT